MAIELLKAAAILLYIGFLVLCFREVRRRSKLPGAIQSIEELDSLQWVASAAAESIPLDSPLREQLQRPLSRLRTKWPYGAFLTKDEVRLLAPFIERWMAGEFEHFLAVEHDYSNEALAGFRERMKAHSMWPAG